MTPLRDRYMATLRDRYMATGMRPLALHWWARPDAFTLFFLTPLFLICASLPDRVFLTWKHSQNFMTPEAFAVAMAALCGFALAIRFSARFGGARAISYGTGGDRLVATAGYRAAVYAVFAITLGAYILLLPGEIAGADLPRTERDRIAGVTSFVNVGPLYVTLLFLQHRLTGTPLSRFDKMVFTLFVPLVLARVFYSSERLAFLELLIPIVIVQFSRVGRHRVLMTLSPVLGVLGLAIFFGVTEYFRSWATYYSRTGVSLTEFVATRLLGYYATAINNGAVFFSNFEPDFAPVSTAKWLISMPGLSELKEDWTSERVEHVEMVYRVYGNPEFTNRSGIFAPMNDFGTLGGIATWIVLGVVTGRLFHGFVTHRILSTLLFPTWMTGVYEVLRVFYFGSTRYFPVLVLTPIVAGWLTTRSAFRPRHLAA